MTQSLILAIDQGGQSSRIAVYTKTGEQLCCFSASCTTTHRLVNGVEYIEQNPLEILTGIQNCLEKITTHLAENVKNIIAAGFAGQGSSLLCWNNKTGEALSPVLSWQDVRGDTFLKNLSLTNTQVKSITGLRASPHFGASKIRWCLDNNSKVVEASRNNLLNIGPIVSYILWHLTGNNFVDPGHAQRTLLWDLSENDWSAHLLNVFSISRNILPECKYHNSDFGHFYLGAQKICFTACARDQGASLFSRGLPDTNACYINIGTGAFIQRVSDSFNAPEGFLVSPLWLPEIKNSADTEFAELSSPTCYAAELTDVFSNLNSGLSHVSKKSLYAWEATVNGAASAISFLQQQTGLQINPDDINGALDLNPHHNCYFLNAVGGLSAPYWRTDLLSTFSENLTAQEKILAWVESVVFQISVNVNLMQQSCISQKIYISGGLSNSNALCQKIADLTKIAVHRSENADASLQGIACMAAGIPEQWFFSAEESIFQPNKNTRLNKRFEVWSEAMRDWLAKS